MNPAIQVLNALRRATGSELLAEVLFVAGSALVAALVGRMLAQLCTTLITRWLTPFDTQKDKEFDASVNRLRTPLTTLATALMLRIGLPIALPSYQDGRLAHLMLVVAIIAGGWLVYRMFDSLEELAQQWIDLDQDDNLHARQLQTQLRGFRNIANFVLLVTSVGCVLLTFESVQKLGTGLLASAGVAGVILGFAAQRSISTIVAGVQIALTQPIRVDDVVIVEGEWGRIEEIRLTYVVVRIWDKRRLVVPVNYFLEKPFQNWTRVSADLLGAVELHVDYSVPVEAIRKETNRILETAEHWDRDVVSVQVTDSNNKSMLVRVLVSAKDSGKAWDLRCHLREQLIQFLQKEYPDCLPRVRAELQSDNAKT